MSVCHGSLSRWVRVSYGVLVELVFHRERRRSLSTTPSNAR